MTGEFTRNPDLAFPGGEMERLIAEAAGPGRADFLDATRIATALLGDSIATNLFMLGYAWQKGLVPLSAAAIDKAIELNQDRKSVVSGKSGSVRVDLGGRRSINKKKKKRTKQ